MTAIVEQFGNCRVVERITSGPLTHLYHAVQEPSGLDVAIKALRPTISPTSPFAAQLVREAQLLARLHHPNILQLYDFVRSDAAMWLVLEWVPGLSLAEVLAKSQRLSSNAAAAIGVEIAQGLAHAHERGMIHRDLRPANVLVSKRGEIKIAHFGIAHDDRVPSSPEPLETGSTFGTPAYMSPEQILGEPIDARTDVFSLGIVLFEMMAGVRPFEGPDTRTVAQRIRHDPPPLIRSIVPDVPRAIERVVLRCLEKLPGDRFAGAAELGAALEAALRASTSAPKAQLVTADLVRTKLVDRISTFTGDSALAFTSDPAKGSLWPTVSGFFVLLALVAAGGGLIQYEARNGDDQVAAGRRGPLELVPQGPGFLRVVAHPWARVIVDGQMIDTTPFARTIPLTAGTHYVTLKHPSAPDERRILKIGAGETVALEVTMGVNAPAPSDSGPTGRPNVTAAEPPEAGAPPSP